MAGDVEHPREYDAPLPADSQFGLRSVFVAIAAISALSACLSQGHIEFIWWVLAAVLFLADPRVIVPGLLGAVAALLIVFVIAASGTEVPGAVAFWITGLAALCTSIARMISGRPIYVET